MNDIAVSNNKPEARNRGISRMLFVAALVLVSLPFLVATIQLALDFINKPVGKLWQARMLESMLFNFGFWMGLCGTAVALASTSEQRRTLGAAATLFGMANIVLGFALRRVFELSVVQVINLTPLILPLTLWFLAILIAVRAPGRQEEQPPDTNETTEAQQ